jgi:UDP-N-acetylglucosamine--N-acetylmuramyl-(pentapeptide) pyrophosphoryl-undecaprenol N-acetylglucosamine transferase
MRVVLAGGGSAGHIEPALALADALRQADSSIQVTCLGTARGLETRLVPLRGYDLELIPAVPLPRSVTPQLLTVPGRLAGAVHGVGVILERVGADVLVGFGGYVATPAYLAAKRHKVPIVVHEANPLPGIANRLGSHLTTHVFTGHPDTKLRNAVYLGLPIRRQIAELDRFALGDKARTHFGLRLDLPVLLVFGGSQGAMSLNRALAGAVGAITNAGVQVLHITGPKHLNEIKPPPGPVPYVAVPYVDQMDLAYAAADFALCRGGAMTCAELTAVGLPAAYVPLPHGNGEQRLNALPIVQRGGGLLVDDAELSAEWIKSSLLPVLTNIDQVAGMSEAAAAMGRKDADRWLAKAVIDVVAAEAANRPAAGPANPPSAQRPAPPVQQPVSAPQSRPQAQARPQARLQAQPRPQGQPPLQQQQEPQPGSLFTPRTTRQQPPGPYPQENAPFPTANRQYPQAQYPQAQYPRAQPPTPQPPMPQPQTPEPPTPPTPPGPGRHRQARS